MARLWAKKSIERLRQEAQEDEHSLRRVLGPINLISLGIGAIVGAGIFVLSGVAAQHTGPALVLSVILSGVGCAFAGLCYAEFASLIPIAGSAYSYSYTTLGEIVAWIIGWDLILEYGVSVAAVAGGCLLTGGFGSAAAAPAVPEPLRSQLAEGGRLILPVGDAEDQELRYIERQGTSFLTRVLEGCRFGPLVGYHGWKEPPAR